LLNKTINEGTNYSLEKKIANFLKSLQAWLHFCISHICHIRVLNASISALALSYLAVVQALCPARSTDLYCDQSYEAGQDNQCVRAVTR